MNADLHCHSIVSDGTLAPADVVRRAAHNGVDLLALTDHDDVAGLAAARQMADELNLRFVDGVEISVTWEDTAVHIVGLGVDWHDPKLSAGLSAIRAGRLERAERMARAFEALGIHGALDGARRFASNPELIGRTHFARFLVERKIAPDVRSVFGHYLARGKPGYVQHQWAGLEQAVAWICNSGGIAVIAHPGRYRLSNAELHRLFSQFRDCGGTGIEVSSGAHSPEAQRTFARAARHFGFAASRASDFHAPDESLVDLGAPAPLPDDLVPVWRKLL